MPHVTRRRAVTTLAAALTATATATSTATATPEPSARRRHPRPLRRAHAHNDYLHPRPLLDALDHRFTSVEADIFLVDGQLLVAHEPAELDPSRTLESLYLDPLRARVRAGGGSVYPGWGGSLQLLIDLKTEGASTYLELHRHLRRYRELCTTYDHGRVHPGPVTAVISGDRAARDPMAAQTLRYAFYDGRLADLGGPGFATRVQHHPHDRVACTPCIARAKRARCVERESSQRKPMLSGNRAGSVPAGVEGVRPLGSLTHRAS
ncbi:hypothetical protein [Streptomyces sp. NPDC002851]